MFTPSGERLVCPVCKQPLVSGRLASQRDIEPAAIAFIQNEFNEWQPEDGACTNCVQNVLNTLAERVANGSHITSADAPFYGILPVGLRLGVNEEYDGSGVTIAFLDSGFSNHPDLENRIKLYVDASMPEIRELSEVELSGDLSWHGTMTSVVACGNGSLSEGLYRGLASGADVLLIRVSDTEGHITDEGIQRGLGWLLTNARRYGVQLVNISLGGNHNENYANNPVNLMVEALIAQGILVVCAAGNDGQRSLVPPASAPSTITVGGLDDKNTLDPETCELWHSNYGQTHTGVWKPEVVAPSLWLAAPVLPNSGVAEDAANLQSLLDAPLAELPTLLQDIEPLHYVQLPEDFASQPPEQIRQILREAWQNQKLINQHYQHVDGTSFAAPIVTSVAAQMLQANPGLSPAGLKDLIMRTARYLPEVSPDQQGHGVVDPWAAVAAALTTISLRYSQPAIV